MFMQLNRISIWLIDWPIYGKISVRYPAVRAA